MEKEIEIDHKIYTLFEIIKNYKEGEFVIPKYQRRYVWEPKKREDLIDSLLKGYPIGSIIIWKDNNKSFILDGQQRTRSLLKIREHPFKDMKKETFESLFNNRIIEFEDNMLDNIHSYLRKKSIEELYVDLYNDNEKNIIKDIINKIKTSIYIESKDINNIAAALNQYVAKLYSGREIKIPAIIIQEANEKEAIEIFERLNLNGIKLTLMEKLSAYWSTEIINIKDESLKKLINNIYNIDESNNIRDLKENTPSDIIWALLINSFKETIFFKSLFTEDKDGITYLKPVHMDKLIWLIRVAIGKENSSKVKYDYEEDKKLGEKISKIIKNDEDWIIRTSEIFNKAWKQIEKMCPILKKEHNNKYIFENVASTNLFISMVCQIFNELKENENFKSPVNLQLVLIKEILNGSYESSTNIVVLKTIEEKSYLKDIDIENIKNEIDLINNKQKEDINFRKGFQNIVKLIISISYSEYSNNKIDNFDFDHIIPKNFLAKKGLSIGQNSIGNCGLLDSFYNKSKKDTYNIDELLSDKLTRISNFNSQEYLKLLNIFKNSESREDLNKIFDYRYKFIINKFIKNINPVSD